MPRILLPLLLCLSLIASTVGAAWMATAMAVPAQASMVHDADHACCTDEGGHAHDAGTRQPAMPECDSGQCDCMHCNLLPAPVVPQLAIRASSPEPSALPLLRHGVTPEQLHRPPIT